MDQFSPGGWSKRIAKSWLWMTTVGPPSIFMEKNAGSWGTSISHCWEDVSTTGSAYTWKMLAHDGRRRNRKTAGEADDSLRRQRKVLIGVATNIEVVKGGRPDAILSSSKRHDSNLEDMACTRCSYIGEFARISQDVREALLYHVYRSAELKRLHTCWKNIYRHLKRYSW